MLNPTIAPDARLLEKRQVVEVGYGIQMAFKKNGLIPEKKFRWTSELQHRRPRCPSRESDASAGSLPQESEPGLPSIWAGTVV